MELGDLIPPKSCRGKYVSRANTSSLLSVPSHLPRNVVKNEETEDGRAYVRSEAFRWL